MEITLYKTIDSPNTINKTLTDPLTLEINLKRGTDIINPELVLRGDFRGYNYAHIPELHRYYFINSIEQLNFILVKLYLECDVLETYKNDILNCSGTIKRDIQVGDYGDVNANSTVNVITTHKADVTLTLENNIVLTTLEVRNNG